GGRDLLDGALRLVVVGVVEVDVVGAEPLERCVDSRRDVGGGESLELRMPRDLRRDRHAVAVATPGEPAADDLLRFAAHVSVHPRGVRVGRVDVVATGCHERIKHGVRGLLVAGPAEGVAAEGEGEGVREGVAHAPIVAGEAGYAIPARLVLAPTAAACESRGLP